MASKGGTTKHGTSGRVSSIDAHPDGKSATIRVTHGKRKKDPSSGELQSYHQQSSSVTVPKAHAKQYAIGQRVHAGISPANDADGEAPGEVDETQTAAPPVTPPLAAKKKGKAKSKGKGKKAAPRPSAIASAMAPGGH